MKYLVKGLWVLLFSLSFPMIAGCANTDFHDSLRSETATKDLAFWTDNDLEQTIYLIKVNPKEYTLSIIDAKPLETTSSMSKRSEAMVAINGGFFKKDGGSASALKIDSKWVSKPYQNRGVVGWTQAEGTYYFDRLITRNGRIQSSLQNNNSWWTQADFIIGGAPLLIYRNQILNYKQESISQSFSQKRFARTALCQDKQNQILVVVVEGSDSFTQSLGFNRGMTVDELALFLKRQGCVHALNLDGGYSTTLTIKNHVINNTLPLGERKVGNSVVIQSR